ncbi:MAG: PHP domain-containing protein [Holophaga sp.]|nr:PHP domain-containing protein [Holophaga sp.]
MIDLHSHSIFSDGTDTPEALALAADAAGLKALALTDHDTLAGLDRFMATQPRVTTLLVPGIELSCRFMGRSLHMLGLFLDVHNPVLREGVAAMRRMRLERNQAMVQRLQARGIAITMADLQAEAPTDLVSRTHFARVLVRQGAAGSPEDAFRRLIGDDGPCYVPFPELAPREAVRWIRASGGVAVVAHPGRGFARSFRWDEAMLDLKRHGVQGFEAYYPDYGPMEQAYFLALAEKLELVASGGSDYHGGHKPGLRLGVGRGGLQVPDAAFGALRAVQARNALRFDDAMVKLQGF